MTKELFLLAMSSASMQEVVDRAEDVLGNPIALIDYSQNEPFFSKGCPKEDLDDKVYRRGKITQEEYDANTKYMNALGMTGVPHIVAWENIRRRRMICGMIVNGRYVGGIRLPDVGNSFEEMDKTLVAEVAQTLGAALMLRGWPGPDNSKGQYLLWNILSGRANDAFLENDMIYPLFEKGSVFEMLWCPQAACGAEQTLRLLDLLRQQYYVPYAGGFAVLADAKELCQKAEQLDGAARETGALLCRSGAFEALEHLRTQFDRARQVEHYARSAGQQAGIAAFNEYKIEHLLAQVEDPALKRLCVADAVREIGRCDRENGTEYLKTLRAYLKNNQNTALCAAELCIHKNTVLYRINKLAEQFGVDLKNVRTLTSAYVSLLLLEGEKQ